MVLKKVWVPAADSNPRNGKVRAPINSLHSQAYVVESGSDPYFPRGFVNAIPRDDDLSKFEEEEAQGSNTSVTVVEDKDGDDDSNGSSSSGEDDEGFDAETVVHPNMMETALRDLVLCGSLCNTAAIHHAKGKQEWEAHGDPTEVALQASL